MINKPLPHNMEAERATLGAILVEPQHLFAASPIIGPDDFYLDGHRRIFRAMLTLQAQGVAIDLVTVKAELIRGNHLEACGGPAYLAGLTDGTPRALNVAHYAQIIKDASIRRQTIRLANQAMIQGFGEEQGTKDIITSLQSGLLKLLAGKQEKGWLKAIDIVTEAYREIEEASKTKSETVGLDTGFGSLNRMTQGFHPGDLIIVAARPAHGKTTWLTNVVSNGVLTQGWKVGLFTMEMTAKQIIKRALCAEAQVDSYRINSGFLTRDDWRRLSTTASRLADTHLFVDESAGLTIEDLRNRALALSIEHGGLDLLAIDYLQLMSGTGRRNDNRVAEVSEISRGLKNLAKDLGVPVIALSQLSREIEKDKRRKPILSDLRESGSIEQDADVVLFLWREELRKPTPENAGTAELILGKQRNGPIGTIMLKFLPNITKFVEQDQDVDADTEQETQQVFLEI